MLVHLDTYVRLPYVANISDAEVGSKGDDGDGRLYNVQEQRTK